MCMCNCNNCDKSSRVVSKSEQINSSPKGNEHCISCGIELNIPLDRDISLRSNYVEGAGQLCEKCYQSIYSNSKC